MRDILGYVRFGGRPVTPDEAAGMLSTSADALEHESTGSVHAAWRKERADRHWRRSAEPTSPRSPIRVLADARIDADGQGEGPGSGESGASVPVRIGRTLATWGPAAADRLVGDFAFAAWSEEELTLGRDPLSMRPLYYRPRQAGVCFASRPSGLTGTDDPKDAINPAAVAAFLAGAQLPPDQSFYRNVHRVPPGSAITFDDSGRERVHVRPSPPPLRSPDGEDDAIREFWARWVQAVEDRLRGNRSTAIMLSGGADSAAICMAIAGLGARAAARCTALTWTFNSLPEADERSAARAVAEPAGIELRGVSGDDAWPLSDPSTSAPDLDSPFVWPFQALNDRTLLAAKRAGADTVLTGDRGDYVVGDWVYGDGRTLDAVSSPGYLTAPMTQEVDRLNRLAGQVVDDANGTLRHRRILDWAGAQIAEMNARAFRRHGLVYADPWTDIRLIDYVTRLPPHWVNRPDDPKRILTRALARRGLDPGRLSTRTPAALFDKGLRDREVGTVRSLLRSPIAGDLGFVEPKSLSRSYERYVSGESLSFDLWKPVALELWLRRVCGEEGGTT